MSAQTITEVIQQLEDVITETKKEENPLGYFAALYHNVTVTVKDKLNTGYFDDDKRMERLDVLFANRYLKAYHDYKKGNPITQSWLNAFTAAKNKNFIVLQHLLLGMNAHINLDLGIAAAEISTKENISNLEGDFNKINELLSSLVVEIQEDLSTIWPTLLKLLKLAKKADDFAIDFSMKLARNGAWKFANILVGKKGTVKDDIIKERDQEIAAFSKKITRYGVLLKVVFFIIRIGERGKNSNKIKALERV